MSSVRSVLCGRTMLRSKQLSIVVRQISTTAAATTSNNQQSLDLCSVINRNYGPMQKTTLLSVSSSTAGVGRSRYTTALSNLTKDQANELVFRLNDSERQVLLQVLNQFESNKERKRLEGMFFRYSRYSLINNLVVVVKNQQKQ